jgi:hypothetical protein
MRVPKHLSRGLGMLVALMVAVLVFVPAGAALEVYDESAGDAPGGAPDITAVGVRHTFAGQVIFGVAFANRSILSGEDLIVLGIDSDQNKSTGYTGAGRSDGIDWELFVGGDEPTVGLISRWDHDLPDAVVPIEWSDQTMLVVIDKRLVGNPTSAFDFGLVSHTGGAMKFQNTELVPHLGQPWFTYSLATEIVGIWLPPKTVLAMKAGSVFSVRNATVRLSTDELFKPDTLTAKATIAGKALKPRVGGLAWKIPKAAKGKRLVVTMRATFQGMQATQTTTLRIR